MVQRLTLGNLLDYGMDINDGTLSVNKAGIYSHCDLCLQICSWT